MIYYQTITKECIAIRPLDEHDTYFVELMKRGNKPEFAVCIDVGEHEYLWIFDGSNPSDYERVKLNVFDVIFEWDTIHELVDSLDAIFRHDFDNILIECIEYDDEDEEEDYDWEEECEDEDEDEDEDEEEDDNDDCNGCLRCPFRYKN